MIGIAVILLAALLYQNMLYRDAKERCSSLDLKNKLLRGYIEDLQKKGRK